MDDGRIIEATIVIRHPERSSGMAEDLLSGRSSGKSRDEVEKQISADPQDLEAVRAYAAGQGLAVTASDAARRTVRVQGTARRISDAFGNLPAALSPVVTAVLGLDPSPVAKPHPGTSPS